jgi:hypothetical protein
LLGSFAAQFSVNQTDRDARSGWSASEPQLARDRRMR